MQICHTGFADCLLASCQYTMYDINLLLCVQCWTSDNGERNCPKPVEFYSKNKFEKLVHSVDFIIRIYHDARSSEYEKFLKFSWTLQPSPPSEFLRRSVPLKYCLYVHKCQHKQSKAGHITFLSECYRPLS